MPGCSVNGCTNRREKGFRLFKVPAGKNNITRREEWLKLIGRNSLPARADICEVHFGEDQYELNRQDKRKVLRPYAKPNLLLHTHTVRTEKDVESHNYEDTTTRYENSSGININTSDMSIDVEVTLPLHTETTHVETSNTEATHIEATPVETTDTETTHTEAACAEILKDTSNEISDEEHIKRLKIALKKKMEECRLLKNKLQQKDTQLQQAGTQFENIFTRDQRHFLVNRTQRGASWSDETITKGLKLYVACGEKGYEELRQQHLPFPSIRTLQHRIQGLKFKPGTNVQS